MNSSRLNGRVLACATFVAVVAACDRPVTEPDQELPLKNAPPDRTALVALAAGFQEQQFVALGFGPTAMEFSPDGRLFVADQAGRLRVVRNGSLLATPFVTLSVDTRASRGLLGVAFDPAFATNRFVYVYYTSAAIHANRVSRFTADADNPDVAAPGSEVVLLDRLAGAADYHNGGAIHFGVDGTLYVAVGDNDITANAQDLRVREGKLLRINRDGSVPQDNPFVGNPSARGEIWALGFRNPFTFAVQPGTGRIHINDVGEDTWEEINLGLAGANYGWPTCEGVCTNPGFENPIYAYNHDAGRCAITGGTFYEGTQFPAEYVGSYFFADYCGDWIKRRRPDGSVADFATVAGGSVVDLKVGPDGSLYYLSGAARAVYKFTSEQANRAPVAELTASPTSGLPPLDVSFDASRSSDLDGDSLVFSWDFGDGSTAAGVTAKHMYASDGPYLVTLTVGDQRGGLSTATITIRVGNPPNAVIALPSEGATYVAGDVVGFAGEGSDADDGALGESAFSWTILFHHEDHTHPHVGPLGNVQSGTFTIPAIGETSPDVWYRIYLTVTDASGLKTTVTRDVLPVKSTFTLDADPTGLTLTLDGQPVTTPRAVTGVVGMQRTLGAPLRQSLGPGSYDFVSWSDGGAATHGISTPAAPTTYLATYTEAAPAPITQTLLTAGNNIVNQKVYTTAAIAPAPNALITVAVLGHNSTTAPPSPTLSGGGMTAWTEVGTTTFDPLSTPLKRLTIYRAMSAAPGSGPLTITWSASVSNCQWIVSQWDGVETSGVNGAGSIGQIGSNRGNAVSGLAVPLGAFGNPNNVAYGVFGVRSQVLAVTPGVGFTELSEQPSAESPPSDLVAEWTTNVNTIAATWTNLHGAALGVEIKARTAGP